MSKLKTALSLPIATILTAGMAAAADPIRLVPHAIKESQTGSVAIKTLIPAGWKSDDKLVWTFEDPDVPVRYCGTFTSPDGIAKVEFYPDVIGSYSTGPGYATGNKPPADTPIGVLKYAVKALRKDVRFTVVKEEATKLDRSSNQIAIGQQATTAAQTVMLRIAYELNGKNFEEDFFLSMTGTHMVSVGAARLETLLWRCHDMWSVRASNGETERTRKIAQAIQSSARPTIEFFDEIVQVKRILLETGMERIRQVGIRAAIQRKAANEISQTIVDSYWAAQKSNDTRAAQFSDYIRGVEPYRDGNNTVKLPSGFREVWSNGQGEFILSDTNGYNPNRDFNGNWTQIDRSR